MPAASNATCGAGERQTLTGPPKRAPPAYLRARADSNAEVRLCEGWGVVDPVADHAHSMVTDSRIST